MMFSTVRRFSCMGLFLFVLVAVADAADPATQIPGSVGAVKVPFEMKEDGVATVSLYGDNGQLVRILVQAIELSKGDYVVRWDGLDLWGQPVPADTALEARILRGPGVKAKYEFGIASPNPVPWPTRAFGEGEDMRAGGWMGDHGVNSGIVAVGDRMFLSSTVAEHGHTLIMTNLEGEKMWGRGGFEGWKGPQQLASDGSHLYASVVETKLYRTEFTTRESKQIHNSAPHKIKALAAHAGRVLLVMDNADATTPLLSTGPGTSEILFEDCLPKTNRDGAQRPMLNQQQRFATVFQSGGHPQTGISPVLSENGAGILAVFKEPLPIGSMLLAEDQQIRQVELYALKADATWSSKVAPLPGDIPGDAWIALGQVSLNEPLNLLTPKVKNLKSRAIYLRMIGKEEDMKKATLRMARLMVSPVKPVSTQPEIVLPDSRRVDEGKADDETSTMSHAWRFRAKQAPTTESPVNVMLRWQKETSVDGLVLLNPSNAVIAVDAWQGEGEPDPDATKGWREVGRFKAYSHPFEGSYSSSNHSHDARISFDATTHTKALRLRLESGMVGSRWQKPSYADDPFLCSVEAVLPVVYAGQRPEHPDHLIRLIDGNTGQTQQQFAFDSPQITDAAFAADGTLYTIGPGELRRTTLNPAGQMKHEIIARSPLKEPAAIGISPDGKRLAVGDPEANAIFVFNPKGERELTIGGIGPRKVGPWDPHTIDRPVAVAIDRTGDIWVAEGHYTPKRFSRYNSKGEFEKEFLGPPHYGGGGTLDKSLKTFWYQGIEYDVDFDKGTTRLSKFLDVQYHPRTPTLDKSSYTYNKVQRPVYLNGRRYLVGDAGKQFNAGYIIVLHEPGQDQWKPVAVMGDAQNSVFLTRPDKPWHTHWNKQDLAHKSFIWYDANEDGEYQIEEVEIFNNKEAMKGARGRPFQSPYWGTISGRDLTFWGQFTRLAPAGFTRHGVPIFKSEDLQTYNYPQLAPIYTQNFTANSRAKPGFNWNLVVDRHGAATLEGQPYKVGPDMKLVGGAVNVKPADYVPRILGRILDNPLTFTGIAQAESNIGEVSVVNGVNGQWFLWSVDHNVMLDEFFTGDKGTFASITQPKRGMDVTEYRQDWETFFGYFLKADNGKYYVIAGRGHFGLFELQGIDQFEMVTRKISVSDEAYQQNLALQKQLVRQDREDHNRNLPRMQMAMQEVKVDGQLNEWEEGRSMSKIRGKGEFRVGASYDSQALYAAYKGTSLVSNQGEDWRYVFKSGFCLDMMIRTDPRADKGFPEQGDKRLSFAPNKGQWIAVLYDYVAPDAGDQAGVTYSSPVATTRVDRVVKLDQNEFQVVMKKADAEGPTAWTAEVRINWKALGMKPPKVGDRLSMDFGVLIPDAGGMQVAERNYWSNPHTRHVADTAVEAEIEPRYWGNVTVVDR